MKTTIQLESTESVELVDNGENALIKFRCQGEVIGMFLPVEEVAPLAMKLLGAPLVTSGPLLSYDGAAPSLDAEALEVSRHDLDPDAIYLGVRVIDHVVQVRIESALGAQLKDALTRALLSAPDRPSPEKGPRH